MNDLVLQGLFVLKKGRVSRHANLNHLIKPTLASVRVPSALEPTHHYRIDNKRPDGLLFLPWKHGKELSWDLNVVDALARSCLKDGSVGNPGTVAVTAEERRCDKYRDLSAESFFFSRCLLKCLALYRSVFDRSV